MSILDFIEKWGPVSLHKTFKVLSASDNLGKVEFSQENEECVIIKLNYR